MSKIVLDVSISLDGFSAGPNVRPDEPMGDGGERLHDWMAGEGPDAVTGTGADIEVRDAVNASVGAALIGRRTFELGLRPWGGPEVLPGAFVRSDAALAAFVRRMAMTTYHYAGTCRMGQIPGSVVDPQLRVRGVENLRVADASIIPEVPVSALNAPSMMIGWRAADLLRAAASG